MEREALLKRKSEFDIASEGPNKRMSASGSSSSSYTSEDDQSHPAVRNSHTSAYHSSAGSGSHRRRRKRASSLVRSSHSRSSFFPVASSRHSSAASVQRADEGDHLHYSHAHSQAISFVGEYPISERTPSSTSTSSSLAGACAEQNNPLMLCDANRDGPEALDSSTIDEREGEDRRVTKADNEDNKPPPARPSTPRPLSDALLPLDSDWDVHTPQRHSAHMFQPNVARRGMEDIRRWYGKIQPQTPSTPTPRGGAMLRTLHTDPSLVPIPASPEDENELQLYTENTSPLPLVQSKYLYRPHYGPVLLTFKQGRFRDARQPTITWARPITREVRPRASTHSWNKSLLFARIQFIGFSDTPTSPCRLTCKGMQGWARLSTCSGTTCDEEAWKRLAGRPHPSLP